MRRSFFVLVIGILFGGFAMAGLNSRVAAQEAAPNLIGVMAAMVQPGSWIVHLETNWNRYGGDIYNVETPSPENCQGICAGDARCKSFTWVRPRDPRLPGMCWIKGNVPGRSYNTCCISGVKYVPGSGDDLEAGVNRPGGDFNNLPASSAAQCRNICQQQGGVCRAFTFVTATGRCWLKNDIPRPQGNSCCTSGVVRPYDSTWGMY